MNSHIKNIIAFGFLSLASLWVPATASANSQSFDDWLSAFRNDAINQGISKAVLDEAFNDVSPQEDIIALDRKQPEGTRSFAAYAKSAVSPERVSMGRELYNEHKKLLNEIGSRYGVDPFIIVALWGIESNYGGYTGGFNIVEALATLAYDGRRSEFFRNELFEALKIIDHRDISASEMTGSWAGAMGQSQFMPSTYQNYAVDYDGDGKRDIWETQSDVFASIANYLRGLGWEEQGGWGFKVRLPSGFPREIADIKQTKPMSQWATLGVTQANGKALPSGNEEVSLIFIGKESDAPAYIIKGNFKRLLQWNRSRYFATAVGMLADEIKEAE